MSIRSMATVIALAAALVVPAAFAKHAHTATGNFGVGAIAASEAKTRGQVERKVLQAQREGYFDKMRADSAYAPEFDRQAPSVLTRSEVRLEVAHARHDGALQLTRGEGADSPSAYATVKGLRARSPLAPIQPPQRK